MNTLTDKTGVERYYRAALWLGIFTVLYNLLEGVVSIYFGVQDEALTLFGFGVDSFIECLSGLGIIAMTLRIQRNASQIKSEFEKSALQVTGASFFLLAAGLAATAIYNLLTGQKPETTLAGVIIAIISILIMWALVSAKRRVGHALQSEPILADANCTLVCIYMSLVLLASSLVYQLTGFGMVDSLGAFGLIYFAVQEGREAFEKAKGRDGCTCNE